MGIQLVIDPRQTLGLAVAQIVVGPTPDAPKPPRGLGRALLAQRFQQGTGTAP